MSSRFRVDEMGIYACPVLIPLHRAFETVAHAEVVAYLLGVDALALKGKHSIASDHKAVADARQIGRQILRNAIGEIILVWIAREVRERQHDDGKMRGCRRPRLSGDADLKRIHANG